MNPYSGEYVSFSTLEMDYPSMTMDDFPGVAAQRLGISEDEMIELRGHEDAVKALSHRVRLGEAELERRKARRKAQKHARRNNR